jgi:hypothetical protein
MQPARTFTPYVLLIAGPALVLLGLLARILPRGLRPVCLTHALTGVPCPGCGSFRALGLFATGQVKEAFFTQPLMTLLFSAIVLTSALAALLRLLGRPMPAPPRIRNAWRILLIGLCALLVLLNWL